MDTGREETTRGTGKTLKGRGRLVGSRRRPHMEGREMDSPGITNSMQVS